MELKRLMLHSSPVKRRRKKKFSMEDYIEVIRAIREAPAELSNEQVMEKVTEVYGAPSKLAKSNVSVLEYIVQLIIIVTIVSLFILTISFVSAGTVDKESIIDDPSNIIVPGSDVVF